MTRFPIASVLFPGSRWNVDALIKARKDRKALGPDSVKKYGIERTSGNSNRRPGRYTIDHDGYYHGVEGGAEPKSSSSIFRSLSLIYNLFKVAES